MIVIGAAVWFAPLKPVDAVVLNLPPVQVVKLEPGDSKVKIAKVIPRKKDSITYKSPKEIVFLTYLTDPRLSSNQQVLKIIDELTPGMARENRNKTLVILLLLWVLKVNQVQAAPLPGADGFIRTYICRKRQTYSREATGLNTHLKENPDNQNIPRENRAMYDRRVGDGSILEDLQVRKKFKHAPDFGILGNPNRKNYELFKDRIVDHMKNPSTRIKEGTYKKILKYYIISTRRQV